MVCRFGQRTMMRFKKIMGFKRSRYKQWWAVLEEERGNLTVMDWLGMGALAVKGAFKGRKKIRFAEKMRGCSGCVIYDAESKKCRPFSGSNVGCGCYMPFKVALGGGCWANEQGIKEESVGWPNI